MAVAYNTGLIITNGSILLLDPANPLSFVSTSEAKDLSKTENNTTLVNGISITQKVFTLDGSDDFKNITKNSSYEFLTEMTVDLWINFNFLSPSINSVYCFVANTNVSGRGFGLIGARTGTITTDYKIVPRIITHNNNNLFFNFSDVSLYDAATDYNSSTGLIARKWNNLVLTGTINGFNCWVNGIKSEFTANVNSNMSTAFQILSLGLHFGARPNNAQAFIGDMSHIKIYNRVLSDEEILKNFNALRGRFGI